VPGKSIPQVFDVDDDIGQLRHRGSFT